jgi:phospholipase/carboxylesterase
VDQILKETGLTPDRVVLGGFSQGSMVATEVALHESATPAALLIYSGTLLCESRWRNLAQRKSTLKVFQSHGRSDTLLPYSGAEALHRLFVECAIEAEFLSFSGPHTIPSEALDRTSEILVKLCSQK